MRRDLHRHLGPCHRTPRRTGEPVGVDRAHPLDGSRAARGPPRARSRGRRRAGGRSRGRVQHQRRRRHARRTGDDSPARTGIRARRAGPDPGRDADADPQLDVRDRRGPARHGPAGLAQLPPLPARGVRRVRRALGRPRGRRVRPGGPPLRGDGRRRARAQLPAAGSRHRDAGVAARLHRSTARRVPQPRVSVGRRLAPGGGRGRRGIRRARAPVARGGRADSRRLLWRRAGADRGCPHRARRAPSRATPARPRSSTKAPGRSRHPSANARP